MRVSRLIEEQPTTATAPAAAPEREARVEAAGGVVHIRYLPVPSEDRDLPTFDLLRSYVTGWDATNDQGEPEPLNADRIHQLTPAVKDAFREAILARPKAKPEEKHEKPAERAHGSFEPVEEKETARGSK